VTIGFSEGNKGEQNPLDTAPSNSTDLAKNAFLRQQQREQQQHFYIAKS